VYLEVSGVAALAELCEELSPRMAEAFWATLPIETTLTHGKWSGSACFFQPTGGPMRTVTALEYPVCSIYPGVLVARPGGSEVLISYGPAEYRWAIGTDYTTPVAKIVENREALLKALARMHDEGDKVIAIRRQD
jgi:hypothetical protein